jgi:hypothetical protein
MRTHNKQGKPAPGNTSNLSKIGRALSILKPFKSTRTDGFAPALLQQGAEHLLPHLCRIFRACMAHEFIPRAWRQEQCSFQSPGRLITPTLIHIQFTCGFFSEDGRENM